jgi:hypothetical protein
MTTMQIQADDICYQTPESGGTFLFPKRLFPITNISDETLQNVQVQYAIDGFAMSFNKKIGIDGNTYTNALDEDKAENADSFHTDFGNGMPNFTAFDKGVNYHLDDMSPDETNKVWTSQFIISDFMSSFFSTKKLFATYTKNDVNYTVVLNPCGTEVPEVSVQDQTSQSQPTDSTMDFNVTIDGTLSSDVGDTSYVHYYTVDGTAKSGTDYTAVDDTLEIPRGTTSTSISVTIKANGSGNFYLILDNAYLARINDGNATGTITSLPIVSTYVTGPFDAWDTFRDNTSIPPADRNISTKVVNTPFKLSLASLNKDNNAYETKSGAGSSIDVAIYPKNSNVAISNHITFDANTDAHIASSDDITVTSANPDAVVGFKLCATYEHNISSSEVVYVLHPVSQCAAQTTLNDCDSSTTGFPTWHICHAGDDFAIRPYAFRVFGGDAYSRAGEDFNVTIKAVDLANFDKNSGASSTVIGTSDYNASFATISLSSNFYNPTPTELDIMYKNVMQDQTASASSSAEKARVATCSTAGVFTKINATDNFTDGNLNATLNFSETGILTIDVNETLGQEFAIVDADDTNISQRFILGSSTIHSKSDISKNSLLLVNPYSIDTTAEYNTSTSKAWLYMDDISNAATTFTKPNMSAYIHYTVTARNKNGAITQNFSSTCFPDVTESWPTPLDTDCPRVNGLKLNTTYDFKLAATINTTAPVNLSIFNGDKNENALYIDTADQDANLSIGDNAVRKATMYPKQFTNGTAESFVHFNIDRNTSTPLNPITITVVDANSWLGWSSSASPAAFNGTTLNKSYNFIYGRTNAPRQRFTTDTGVAFIYYEVYCSGTDTLNNSCDKTLLPNSSTSKSTNDPRWFKNTLHITSTDGIAGTTATIVQKNSLSNVNTTNVTSGNPTNVTLSYNGSSFPYKTTMKNTASKWLIYNKYDDNATSNEFEVEFINANSNWAGKKETDNTTNKKASDRTNRRTMW